jgi:phage terminase small subunit
MAARALNARTARFVDEYLVDGNGTAAAIRAGYAVRSAHVRAARLIKDKDVAEAIRRGQAENERMLKVDRAHVLAELQRAYDLAKARSEPSTMVAACREIARVCGWGNDQRVTIAAPTLATLAMEERVSRMSDEELEAIVAARG